MTTDLEPRLRSMFAVEHLTGCWAWHGVKSSSGYGRYGVKRRKYQAHRVVYEALIAPIPAGLQLDHLCRNRACVNPAHLDPVTCRINVLRGKTLAAACAAKTHCLAGHPFEGDNLYVTAAGKRQCRACARARRAQRAAAKDAA